MTTTSRFAGLTQGKQGGLGLALIAAVCFGTSGPFAKPLINAGLTPVQAAWIRIMGGALVLVALLLIQRRVQARRSAPGARNASGLSWTNWRQLAGYGLLGVAGCQVFYFIAAERLPVGIAILLEFTGPILVVCWLRLVVRVHVPSSAITGVAIALLGLACVVQVWDGLRLDTIGLLAGLGAAACQASGFLIADRASGKVSPLTLTTAGCAIGAVSLIPIALPWNIQWSVFTSSVAVGEHSAPGWALAVWIAVIATVVAYLAGVASVQRLSAPVAGGVAYTEAVATTIIAWIVLGERLSAPQLTGGLIVLVGAFIAQRSVAAKDPAPQPELTPVPVTAG